MKTYKQFLIERFSKSDFNSAFRDPNIRVGLEFEFYLRDEYMGDNTNDMKSFAEELYLIYKDYRENLDRANQALEEFEDEILPILRKYKETLKDEDDIDEIDGWISTIELEEYDDYGYVYEYLIENNLYSSDDFVIIEMFNNRQWESFIYAENNTNFDKLHYDIPLNFEFIEDIDSFKHKFFELLGDKYLTERHFYILIVESIVSVEGNIENVEIWSELPFSDFEIGDYHESSNYDSWRIERDTSLNTSESGVEIISPVLEIDESFDYIIRMFRFISSYGYTDDTCGFHVNISYKGENINEIDLLKIIMFIDEDYVWNEFPDRINNNYTRSVYETLSLGVIKQEYQLFYNNIERSIVNIANHIRYTEGKYYGINQIVDSYEGSADRIEFRYLGGSGYEDSYNEIQRTILQYGYLLILGFDPELRKKEYIKKLVRLLNRLGYDKPNSIDSYEDLFKFDPEDIRITTRYDTVFAEIKGDTWGENKFNVDEFIPDMYWLERNFRWFMESPHYDEWIHYFFKPNIDMIRTSYIKNLIMNHEYSRNFKTRIELQI